MSYTGQPFKRLEDERLVTGRGSYVDDLKLPGLLHAPFSAALTPMPASCP